MTNNQRLFVIYLIMQCTNGGTATEEEYAQNLMNAHAAVKHLKQLLLDRMVNLNLVRIVSPQLMFSELYGVVPHRVVMDWCEQLLGYADLALHPPDGGETDGVMQELACCAEEIDGRPAVTVVREFEMAANLASDWLNQGGQ